MDTTSNPTTNAEMPPPQTKEVIKNDKAVVEILDSDSDGDEPIYKFNFDIEDLIASTLNEFGDPEKNEESPKITQALTDLSGQIKGIERKQKEIEKIFSNCEERLRIYQQELEEADKEEISDEESSVRLKEVAAEMEAREAAEANAKNEETDSDDDVQFIASSFDPEVAAKNKRLQVLKIPPGSNQKCSSPTLANLRQALTGAINDSINQQQQGSSTQPSTKSSSVLSSAQTRVAYHELALDVKVGSKVLGKKHNDIWYKGTVADMTDEQDVANRDYTVKFDGKGKKTLRALNCAFKDPLSKPVAVGTRVVALYKDEESMASFYAGIVAETPNQRNAYRYLIFFDDGYAQYSRSDDIHKVLAQSLNVWEDIHQDSQEFIKDYLKQYPERPMVRLNKGQTVRTEWNGKWWTAKVEEVDSSLAKMYFLADKRIEWIYRGSTRLEPLFTALSNANKATGKMRRTNMPTNKKHVVEYTRGNSEDGNLQQSNQAGPKMMKNQGSPSPAPLSVPKAPTPSPSGPVKKRSVARKSTTGSSQSNQSNTGSSQSNLSNLLSQEKEVEAQATKWEGPWLKLNKRHSSVNASGATTKQSREIYSASSISSNKTGTDMASVLQERLSKVAKDEIPEEESFGERLESNTCIPVKDQIRKMFTPHLCGPQCLQEDDPEKYKGTNPLLIPLLCGWERQVCKIKPAYRRIVLYRAPCARRLRSMDEVDYFLELTDSSLTIDLFCFDPQLHVHKEFVPVKTFCDIKDLSYGKENVPISCVNAIDRLYPDYVEYSNVRIPTKGVKLNLDQEFLVCCDCTDNCRDKSKCACQQMTVESTSVSGGKTNPEAGYQYRRLQEPIVTGIYECNSKCKCDNRCVNRVAQNPLTVRLQVFKTEKRGWGLRCLDDIPTGGFICIYAGQLLTEQGANTDGQQYGDEYLAELDYMEVVEGFKEGYESSADPDEGLGENSDEEEEEEEEESEDEEHNDSNSDSDYDGKVRSTSSSQDNPHHTREMRTLRTRTKKQQGSTETKEENKKEACKLVLRRDSSRSTDHEEWTVKFGIPGENSQQTNDVILINDDDDEEDHQIQPPTNDAKLLKSASNDSLDSDSLPDLDEDMSTQKSVKKELIREKPVLDQGHAKVTQTFTARRSTTSRFKNLPDPKRKFHLDEHRDGEGGDEEPVHRGTRWYYQDGQACYIMDAKSQGNIGRYLNEVSHYDDVEYYLNVCFPIETREIYRYLNHSCNPNVFVQNVFADTHDLRFPWVAFFTLQYVRAGTELTWDYNYEVGSVAGKVLYCYCGSSECRGRLL
ncbi:histone-lysine N-methyltransferase SETDB1-like isoform X3 [Ostrea edulis]|uniref:histone-lysine N-methyltransferase SETDB1-like isoform X3 n=1 Tax=Ostrea edulis TaxID=37623 RepID=UPI0024AFED46|nr:histone-lysine N-methyltransferase SETDB1-like isoform X3 [Ostrea edulis]